MIKRPYLAFVCLTTVGGTLGAAWGCSSSTTGNPAGSTGEAGTDTGTVKADAGEDVPVVSDGGATLKLQWGISAAFSPSDGGPDASDDASSGPPDSGDDGGNNGNGPPLAGVQVCIYQNSAIPCVTSASDGTFTITGLTARTKITLSLNKAGYQPTLVPIETASTDMDGRSNPLFLNASETPDPTNLGITIDWQNKGQVIAFAIGPQLPDAGNGNGSFANDSTASMSISPASGNGPFYQSANGPGYDPTVTTFAGFFGAYFNLAPGTYTLTYSDPNNDCEPISFPFSGWGFPVTTPAHSLQVPVAAGYITGIVGQLCTPNSVIATTDGGRD